jgi:D-alanyl-D-alanine carboxypeptidase
VTPKNGSVPVTSAMITGWSEQDREKGALGYPTKAMNCGLPNGGCYQQFQGGKVYWSKSGGSQPIYGSIMNQYQSLGNEHSRLGYPTSGENCSYSGGACRQTFQRGYIQWTPGRGTIYRYN